MLPLYRLLSMLVILSFGVYIQAQPCQPAPAGGDDCTSAPLLSCNLDGYMGSTAGYTPGPAPTGFCGLVENDQYFRFIADEVPVALQIIPSNCTTAKGLQSALYETTDCITLNPVSACASFGSANTLNVVSNSVIVGNEYYLMIDGFEGDICDFTIVVVQGIISDVVADAENAELCLGNSIQLDGTASTQRTNVEYLWSTTNGNIVSDGSTTTPTIDALGDYTLSVVDVVECCVDEITISVTENMSTPSFNFDPSYAITCTDTEVTLDPNLPNPADYTYIWTTSGAGSISMSTPSTGSSIIAESAGTYNLEIRDIATGCTYDQDVVVDIDNADPDLMISSTNNLDCNNTSTTISANSTSTGLMYSWTGPNSFTSTNASFMTSDAGTYAVTITATNGCTVIDNTEVTLSGNPDASIDKERNLNCLDIDTKLTGSSTTANVSYSWTGPSGPLGTTAEITVTDAGNYTLVVSTPIGCSTTVMETVLEDKTLPNISASVSNEIDCTVLSATLEGASTTTGVTFAWTGPNSFTADIAQPSVNEGGQYILTVTGPNGCTDMATIMVIQNAIVPTADAGAPVNLDCNSASSVIGGSNTSMGAEFAYEWTSNTSPNVIGTDPNLNVTAGGEYTLLVTNTTNNCTDVSTVNVQEDFVDPTADAGPDAFLTCSMRTATLAGSSSMGTEFTYEWTDAAGTVLSDQDTYMTTLVGDYTLRVTNSSNGCVQTDIVTVDEDPYNPEAIVVTPEEITCAEPSVTLSSIGSTAGPGISYEWYDNNNALISTDAETTVSTSGSYRLVVLDANYGCADSILVRVDEDITPPLGSAGIDKDLDCSSNEVTLEASVSGDMNDFDFEWFDDQGTSLATTFNLTTSNPGRYDLVITDKLNGCTRASFATVVDNNTYPDADAGAPVTITCADQQVQVGGDNTTVGNNVIHAWYDATGDLVGNTPVIQVGAPGEYQLVVTNASSSCTAESFVTVDIDQIDPIADAGTTTLLTCNDPTANLNGDQSTASNGTLSYIWLDPSGATISITADAVASAIGEHTLTVTDTQNGCQNTTTLFVDEDVVAPIVSVTNPEIINCYNNFVEVNYVAENGPITPVWKDTNGNTLSTEESYLATQIGTVVLEATSQSNGCVSTASIDIIENKVAPDASIAPPAELNCLILDTDLVSTISNFSTEATYLWTDNMGQSLGQGAELNVDTKGIYTLEITNVDNGCTATFFTEVTQDIELPSAVISNTESRIDCYQTSIDIDANMSSGNAPLSYVWTNDDQEIISTDAAFALSQGGAIMLLVTNTGNGCTANASIQITEDTQAPVISFNPVDQLTCMENEVDVESIVTGNNNSFVYTWSGPSANSIVSAADTESVTVDAVGEYTLLVQDQINGCQSTAIIQVEEDRELPTLNIASVDELNCVTETVTIDASASSTGDEFDYTWAGSSILNGENSPAIDVDNPGPYRLHVLNTLTGCADSITVQVNENTERPIGASIDIEGPTCFGERNGILSIDSVDGGTTPYLYAVNSDTQFTDIDSYNNLPSGEYTLIIQDGIGCEWDTIFQVFDPEEVTADLGADQIIRLGESSELFVQTSGNIITIEWFDNDVPDLSNEDFRLIQPIKTTTYVVVVTNDEGCSGTDNVVVEVEDDQRVYIPNAFSPNGDGVNDYFTIYTDIAAFEVSSLQIFDKWGSQVFEKNNFLPNIPEIGWDGNWRGKNLQPGSYVYSAFIEFRNGNKINFKGEINIVY